MEVVRFLFSAFELALELTFTSRVLDYIVFSHKTYNGKFPHPLFYKSSCWMEAANELYGKTTEQAYSLSNRDLLLGVLS